MLVFDGHNDALTRADHGQFATGRPNGHLDIPKMRTGGIRGAIFAIFTPTPGEEWEPVERDDGIIEFALADPVSHADAAAFATAAASRLLVLERAGDVRIARRIKDLDDAFGAGAEGDPVPPTAVLHLEGAEAIDAGVEALDTWYAVGLRSLGRRSARGRPRSDHRASRPGDDRQPALQRQGPDDPV